jgi:hypothetical protein
VTLRQAVAGRLPAFVAGLYCVLVCVLPVGLAPTAPLVARLASWVSLLSVPLGLFVPQPRLAVIAGIFGVLGGATITFGAALWVGQPVPVTMFGVLGFFGLSLAWGALSSPAAREGVGQGVVADWLMPRRRVPALHATLARVFLLSLPLLLLVPLRLPLPGQATFALVLSLGAILLLAPRTTDVLSRIWVSDVTAPGEKARVLGGTLVIALLVLALGWVWQLGRP